MIVLSGMLKKARESWDQTNKAFTSGLRPRRNGRQSHAWNPLVDFHDW
jgi:hypothetical protein